VTNTFTIRQITGALVIIGSGSFRHRGTVLSMSFEWPDILRQDLDYILSKFEDGGDSLVFIWFAVAWTYFLLIFPVVLLGRVLDQEGRSSGTRRGDGNSHRGLPGARYRWTSGLHPVGSLDLSGRDRLAQAPRRERVTE